MVRNTLLFVYVGLQPRRYPVRIRAGFIPGFLSNSFEGANNMSQIGNITVFDGASTPVSHTLVPVSVARSNDGKKIVALWREQLGGVPLEGQVTFSTELQQLKSGTWQCTASIAVPVMEAIAGNNAAGYTAAPKVAYTDTCKLVTYHSRRSTVQGRRLSRQLLVNLSNNVSTSTPASASGFVPELIDQLVSAS